ncbi:hypothetical protein ROHU_014094 [Labeo rohita]|uniref:Uncharacterized protein n=1 Tax=Labeo rohita TaxID=84645 RepID=A0A498NWY7_LABRO|nr:hypothetical protein ROHU_017901 [Labeo rohita]RXN36268.1 hypothetical protein ROHU_014094 [Labeo rohita]
MTRKAERCGCATEVDLGIWLHYCPVVGRAVGSGLPPSHLLGLGGARWFADVLGRSGFTYQDYLLEFPTASSKESESLQLALTSQSF